MGKVETTVTFITGVDFGIGKALLAALLRRPYNTLIVGVRDPSSSDAKALKELPTGVYTRLVLLKVNPTQPRDAYRSLRSLPGLGITHIDRVIVNYGIRMQRKHTSTISMEEVQGYVETNPFSVRFLFEAAAPLLRKSPSPQIFGLASDFAKQVNMDDQRGLKDRFGTTMTVLHHTQRTLHLENEWLTAVAFCPCWVKTKKEAERMDISKMDPTVDVEDYVRGYLKVIDAAKRNKYSGTLVRHNGEVIAEKSVF